MSLFPTACKSQLCSRTMVIESAVAALAKGLVNRLGADVASRIITAQQDRRALDKAIAVALAATVEQHHEVFAEYDVNDGFFEHEGAEEIARILLPGRGPDARVLARACVTSLGGSSRLYGQSDPLVAPFQTFLDHFTEELGRHGRFRTQLHEVASTRTPSANDVDEKDYLEWLVGRFEYLQTTGLGTTQHIQLPLKEVFVDPEALSEYQPGLKWRTRAEEHRALWAERLRNNEISYEDYEAELDRLGFEEGADSRAQSAPVSVIDLIRTADRVLVLGDPGTGKTTLLRFLTLHQARAMINGETMVRPPIGGPRLPVYVRAGDFARSRQLESGLRSFLPTFLAEVLQCPVELPRLDDMISRALRAGRCLVLIDGLDEVTTAERREILIASITNFVAAQHPRGNHFVCTSRISGYAAAPLPPEFKAARRVEMNDDAIERFVRLYLPAIDHAEAPAKDQAIIDRDAQQAADALLEAFRRSSGVKRLATNPLLLTALLLVHRTHGALPVRRVDAYKAVTEVLSHTWRVKQGVPEADLPDERQLTRWLTRLADWMHAYRPDGSATVRDLLEQWGPLWGKLHPGEWDPDILDDADPGSSGVGVAISSFLDQVERHSGLLVERAPRRWGFPHLTFEEFYAGRALAFEAERLIGQHGSDSDFMTPAMTSRSSSHSG